MNLPLQPPVLPMLAKRADTIPASGEYLFDPKWDGFRVIVFRDGDELLLQSRDGKALDRYFPELAKPLLEQLPTRCILDGEIVIATRDALDFEALQLRIHPAASRVKLLATETPASIVFFDMLSEGEHDLTTQPLRERRARLEALGANLQPPLHITPATLDRDVAGDWFRRFEGAGLDGVMAKPLDGTYRPDKRALLKIKHERDCDCVVAGFRWYKDLGGEAVGSLLLGLFNATGALQHVGVCASFPMEKRKELVSFLAPYRENALAGHPWAGRVGGDADDGGTAADNQDGQRMPGARSRWNSGKDLSWVALRPELVLEVAYEHMQGTRFRHMAQFRRWRSDKAPSACTYEQLEVVPPHELQAIFRQD